MTPDAAPRVAIIPIAAEKLSQLRAMPPALDELPATLRDQRQRALQDLRISVTDRCNFRCPYCMPRATFGTQHRFLPHKDLLSFEEITRTARAALALGVRKLRLTGGEPLLRKDLPALVSQLAALKTPQGVAPEIALTTNGVLLTRQARALKEAGLQRVTISLDGLDQAVFARMSDSGLHVDDVLAGIEAAQHAGLGPIKVNMVVQRGANDDQILPLARHFRGTGVELRFIEYMDVGKTNRWQLDQVVPSSEVRQRIAAQWPLLPASPVHAADTAERWLYADGAGGVGFISSVTQAFCGDCTRLRLSTDGRLYTCLFGTRGHDLRALLRNPHIGDDELRRRIAALWQARDDRYSELRQSSPPTGLGDRVEMSYIGG
ncbi:GTP 3',8-cyclase MoaA [Aquabacterium parvum]|jgi:cyclic pyranopterin phosphate synthase|uniref:GTP 3',8-cyclase MoaA n=1 Tax=Aquabacterium parvum TaxID=70584 RepID=UPI00071905A3|nr:GTP 3',8-cyclase MoaA [Gammaproteobacteria bacterium]